MDELEEEKEVKEHLIAVAGGGRQPQQQVDLEIIKVSDDDGSRIQKASHGLSEYLIFWYIPEESQMTQRCLSELREAGFDVRKYASVTVSEEAMEMMDAHDQDKAVICITNSALAPEVIAHIRDNSGRFKLAIVFDPSGSSRASEELDELIVGETDQLYRLAELLNEACSKLYTELVKDMPMRPIREAENEESDDLGLSSGSDLAENDPEANLE